MSMLKLPEVDALAWIKVLAKPSLLAKWLCVEREKELGFLAAYTLLHSMDQDDLI